MSRPLLEYEFLVDRAEKPNKCTILPLESRRDFAIRRFARGRPIPRLTADLLLHLQGPPLPELGQALHRVRRLGLVDCHWHRLPLIVQQIEAPLPMLARIPDGFVTAYPRRNKQGLDPMGGLATIEAAFIAAAFLGVWDETLLERYHFASQFLAANASVFAAFGLSKAGFADA